MAAFNHNMWIWKISLALCMLALMSTSAFSEIYMDYGFPDGVLWRVGGFEVYDVIQRGEVKGEARIDYSQLTMLDAPAYRLEWTESWTDSETSHEITHDVKMAAENLRALLCSRIVKVNDDEWRYEGNYSGENLSIQSFYPNDDEVYEYSITKTIPFSDASILPFILRNIPFEENNFITLTVLDVTTQNRFTPIAKITGSEIVETSKSQYDCWVVKVSTSGTGFTAWYSRSDEHYLVKVQFADRELVLNHHS